MSDKRVRSESVSARLVSAPSDLSMRLNEEWESLDWDTILASIRHRPLSPFYSVSLPSAIGLNALFTLFKLASSSIWSSVTQSTEASDGMSRLRIETYLRQHKHSLLYEEAYELAYWVLLASSVTWLV
jgi:hypothetical protein